MALTLGLWAGLSSGASSAERRVVFLGDSLTSGYGLRLEDAYPALIQGKIDAAGLPVRVINAGVSGDTTAGGLRRVGWVLADGADYLVIALGGNDGLRGIDPEQTAQNLARIIQEARRLVPKIRVVVAGMKMPPNMGEAFRDMFADLFPRVAREQDAVLIPHLLEGVGGVPEMNQPDRIHPTAEGQRRIAENVWAVLGPMLERERH